MDESRQVVATGNNGEQVGRALFAGGGHGSLQVQTLQYWTSLDITTDEGAALYLRAKSSEPHPASEFVDKVVGIRDLLFHECQSVDKESGEVANWIRYVLILGTGEMVAGGSDGVRNSLADICQLKGLPPWKEPLKVRIVVQRTNSKRMMHLLQLA